MASVAGAPEPVARLWDLQLDRHRALTVTALVLLLLPSLWYIRTDVALFGSLQTVLGMRFAARLLLLVAAGGGLVAVRLSRSEAAYSAAVLLSATGIVVALLSLNALRPVGSGLPLRSPLFTLALLYAAMPNRFWRQVTPPLVLTLGLVALRTTVLTSGAEADIPGDVVILLAMNMIGVLLVRQRLQGEARLAQVWTSERGARERARLTLNELQTLQGIIPICSYCKRVRAESGDWEQVEKYVRDHSEADFSHGLCPECLDDEMLRLDQR